MLGRFSNANSQQFSEMNMGRLGVTTGRGSEHAWCAGALSFAMFAAGCSPDATQSDLAIQSVSRVQGERSAPRTVVPAANADRARLSDMHARLYASEHPAVLAVPPTEDELRVQMSEEGVPDERFLSDPTLAVQSGLLVADVTFLSEGVRDEYALDARGRFVVPTMRYRVRVHREVRLEGMPLLSDETDVFAPPGFLVRGDGSNAPPRMLLVLGDHAMRPGFNIKSAMPLRCAGGELTSSAFGWPPGTTATEVVRGLSTVVTAGGAP
ncbi:MAG: hypothetical protein U0326_29595 [Polyangiales bacterium]